METTSKSFFVGIGEVLWDIAADSKNLGGAPANFAYHAGAVSKLIGTENRGLVVSAIGKDGLADETIAALEAARLESKLAVVNYDTGCVKVTYVNGEPEFEIIKDVAWDHLPPDGLDEIAEKTRAVCFGTLAQRTLDSRNTIRRFVKAVPEKCLKICDINLRPPFIDEKVVLDSIELCNILKINQSEAVYLSRLMNTGSLEHTDAADWTDQLKKFALQLCRQYHLKMVVVTCGCEGSFIFTCDGESSFQGTPKVEQVSAVGAGDSFTGTLCACLDAGWSVSRAHAAAVAVSAYVVTQPGAMPDLESAIPQLTKLGFKTGCWFERFLLKMRKALHL